MFLFSFIIFTLQVKNSFFYQPSVHLPMTRVICSCRLHVHTGWQSHVVREFPSSFQDPWLCKCWEWKPLPWQPKIEEKFLGNNSKSCLSIACMSYCPAVNQHSCLKYMWSFWSLLCRSKDHRQILTIELCLYETGLIK